jgi:hypothetical protein
VLLARVVSGDRDIPKETKSHRTIVNRVMTRRSDRRETPRVNSPQGKVHTRKHATRPRGCGVPRPAAGDGVCVEPSSSLLDDLPHRPDIVGIVRQLEFLERSVSALEVFDAVKELRILTERARYRAKATDVLGMAPTRVVAATVAVRDERGPHGPWTAIRPVAAGGR